MQNICPLVTVLTIAYNTEQYICQAIESVLNQTYKNIQYVLVNNGSTDKTGDIIKQYGEKDSRLKVVWRNVNSQLGLMRQMLEEYAEGEFFVVLDSDDWFDLNYIERLIGLTLECDLDISCTGCVFHPVLNGETSERALSQRLVLTRNDFAEMFPYYHAFFRTTWGKLFNTKKFLNGVNKINFSELKISYGADTLMSFSALRECEKICVDDTAMYHYRVHKKSVSHKYDPRQSYSDLYLYNDALDFLAPYGQISPQNLDFLYRVYSNAVLDTNANIKKSTLSPAERMYEYRVILERDVTKNAYSSGSEDAQQSRVDLISSVLNCAAELTDSNEDLNAIKEIYFPECGAAVYSDSAKLFLADNVLFDYLLNDYRKTMVKYILSLIEKQKFVKQYDLGEILRRSSQDDPFLSDISDVKFLKKYGDIYLLVWSEKYSDSLDVMTDILLKETVSNSTFLNLYLTLAASLECVDEFIFGKIKLAAYYCAQKRVGDCRAVLNDLTEMGVEDNDEILKIKHQLKSL